MDIGAVSGPDRVPDLNKRGNSGELGKDEFLKLMMIQMQHQDPLNPMDNQAMLSQMAQFSSLEQMSNLNSTLANGHEMQEFVGATQLIGKEVAARDPAWTKENPLFFQGVVESVSHGKDGAILQMDNGMVATIDQLIKIEDRSDPACQAMKATRLIGKEIAILDPNSSEDRPRFINGVVRSVGHDKYGAVLHLESGKAVYAHQIVEIGEAQPEEQASTQEKPKVAAVAAS